MKRRVRLALALALALTLTLPMAGAGVCEDAATDAAESTAADAAEESAAAEEERPEWRAGLSAAKPYTGVPEVNLNERMGYMMFYPTELAPAEQSCRTLRIYLPREDVKAGKGKIYLCTEADGALWSAVMNDSESVRQHTMTAAELNSLIWGSGTCFEITLPKSLEMGKNYFVNMERGGIVTENGRIDSPEVGGTETWAFTLEGEYGVSGMEYRRRLETKQLEDGSEDITYSEPMLKPESGDRIHFDLKLGGEAVRAVVYGYNESVDFPQVTFEESCEVTGEVLTEYPAWGVMFLDAEDNELYRAEFY